MIEERELTPDNFREWAEEEIRRIAAERDAAIAERDEALRRLEGSEALAAIGVTFDSEKEAEVLAQMAVRANEQRDAARALADKLAEALRKAIAELNAYSEQEWGEGFNNPEWNALLAEFRDYVPQARAAIAAIGGMEEKLAEALRACLDNLEIALIGAGCSLKSVEETPAVIAAKAILSEFDKGREG